jgi:response regulator NasT
MTHPLRIAIADDEPRMRDYYRDTLPLLGHRVTCAARTGQDLVRCCRDARPDLVITDIKMPDMDGIDAVVELSREEPIPAILVSAYHDPELFERTKEGHILAYLVKPIKQADLEAAITIAMQRFEQFRALRREAGALRQALEDRKLIERAKGVLMKRAGLDEEEAFLRLQRLARDFSQKMVEVARMILRAELAFEPPEAGRAKSRSTDTT